MSGRLDADRLIRLPIEPSESHGLKARSRLMVDKVFLGLAG